MEVIGGGGCVPFSVSKIWKLEDIEFLILAFNLYSCQNMFWITVSRFSANRKQAT